MIRPAGELRLIWTESSAGLLGLTEICWLQASGHMRLAKAVVESEPRPTWLDIAKGKSRDIRCQGVGAQ